jgi:hypothetical protein
MVRSWRRLVQAAPADMVLDLFQSDHDLDIVGDLGHEMGLTKLEDEHQKRAKAEARDEAASHIYFSIYAPLCSDIELVRKHLDSGVLADLIQKKEAELLAQPRKQQWIDLCYVYVLLGACAMTLGCRLPESYLNMLKKVYTEGGLMPGALKQMHKALFGPDGFQNGVPYDFESKGLLETMNSEEDTKPKQSGFSMMNVMGPGGLFNTGMGDSTSSVVIKELRNQHNNPDVCGGCGIKDGQDGKGLMQCSRCKARKYCGPECQKKSWKVHKKVCEPVKE